MNLSKKSKVILSILVIIAISVFVIYKYTMRPPTKIEDRTVDFTGTSEQLLTKIQENVDAWQDKVVIISGIATAKDANGVTLSENIYCQFKDGPTKIGLRLGIQKITVKGRVIGYDDLLEELKLDQCIIQQQP